jgi:biotin-dependent carboxylase-like uncharacterized protein
MTRDRDVFEVLAAGPLLLVEDLGRPGFAHLGVPTSGALDPGSLTLANRLVGNADDAAGLEVLVGGVRLRALQSVRIALTGAAMGLTVGERWRPWGEAVPVRAGDEVALQPARRGLRSWLAVSGGVAAVKALGSASTDTLAGLGPAPIRAGDRVATGQQPEPARDGSAAYAGDGPVVQRLALRLGPRDDWFTDEARDRIGRLTYVVSSDSNRVAVRLGSRSGLLLDRLRTTELPSEGLVTGAVQVPPRGEPLVFLADHPVTGGYPVIGVVEAADLARCAQLRGGDQLQFSLVDQAGPPASAPGR